MRVLSVAVCVFMVLGLVAASVAVAPVAMAAEGQEIEDEMQSALDRAEAYLDGIDVEPMKAGMAALADVFTGLLSGAPAIVMITLAFAGLFMVLRKVLGR